MNVDPILHMHMPRCSETTIQRDTASVKHIYHPTESDVIEAHPSRCIVGALGARVTHCCHGDDDTDGNSAVAFDKFT